MNMRNLIFILLLQLKIYPWFRLGDSLIPLVMSTVSIITITTVNNPIIFTIFTNILKWIYVALYLNLSIQIIIFEKYIILLSKVQVPDSIFLCD